MFVETTPLPAAAHVAVERNKKMPVVCLGKALKELPPELLVGAFLKVDAKDTAAEGFVACTRAPIILYPDARQSRSNDDSYAQQTCRLRPSIRVERYRSDIAARRVSNRHRRAVDRGIVVSGLSAHFDDDFCPGPSCLHGRDGAHRPSRPSGSAGARQCDGVSFTSGGRMSHVVASP